MAQGNLNKEIIAPAEASGIAQAAFDVAEQALPMTAVMPDRSNGGKTEATWTPNLTPMEADTLGFRAWDSETAYTHTEDLNQEMTAPLLPLTGRMPISERDVIGKLSNTTWMKDRASQILTTLGTRAALRMEIARVNALVDARFSIDDNGIHGVWDFKRASSLNVTAAKSWSDPTADPVKDIQDWAKLVRAANGGVPRAAMTTSAIIDALAVNPSVIALYTARSKDNPARIPRDGVFQVLSQYAGLSDVRMADLLYQDVCEKNGFLLPGGGTSLFPENTFVLLSSFNDQSLGYTLSGPTAEAVSDDYEIGKSENSGLIGALFCSGQPVRYDVYVNGSGLPVLVHANSTLKAALPAPSSREAIDARSIDPEPENDPVQEDKKGNKNQGKPDTKDEGKSKDEGKPDAKDEGKSTAKPDAKPGKGKDD